MSTPPYPPQHWQQPPPPTVVRPSHPHAEPRSYPLVLRTWDYAWWKPVVGIILAVVGLLGAQLALVVVLVVGTYVDHGTTDFIANLSKMASLEQVTPWGMLYLNLGLASLVPITILVLRLVHGLRGRWLASVLPGIRWKFLGACFGASVVALVASLLLGLLLPADATGTEGGHPALPTGALLATAIVVLVTTPLQALGEEYAFRGYLMQALGSLTRSRVAAVIGTSIVFALAHGVQNFPLFFDRFAFGLMAGLVVVLVGGLEAGIALHVLNNLLAFGIAILYGQLDSTLNVSEVSWWQLPVTVVQNGVYLVLVLLIARSMGLRNTSTPPVQQPVPSGARETA